jgi:diguanylate cyclase (GGDEF)-like protein
MMLDTATLRVAFTVVALTMLVLFYLVTFRATRSAYCGWWCAALAVFVLGSAGYLLNGTDHQQWANPVGNLLVVFGAACTWAGARSLWAARPPWWQLGAAPVVVVVVSFLDDPAVDVWAGGGFFLAGMWLMLGLASAELWRQLRTHTLAVRGSIYRHVLRSMAVASGLISVYYLGRWVTFLSVGPDHPVFETVFGSQATTLISTVLLAAVSFSMSSLSNQQQTEDLRARATRDGLTGLLNRTEFLSRADRELRRLRQTGTRAQLILADLDHFKQINDDHGHQAGDRALRAFAAACAGSVRTDDLVGRFGGEEFVVLLSGASPERADQVTADINRRLDDAHVPGGPRLPTVSYGIATLEPSGSLESTIARADSALYRAKALGRDRVVHHRPGSTSRGATDRHD